MWPTRRERRYMGGRKKTQAKISDGPLPLESEDHSPRSNISRGYRHFERGYQTYDAFACRLQRDLGEGYRYLVDLFWACILFASLGVRRLLLRTIADWRLAS